ncbi:MAG: hypothetical protein Q4A09_08530 [Capnocytophaga felis]|nr:hypothetical protein [Capnocytophaga felis]
MKVRKFDDTDRKLLIKEIEKIQGVVLEQLKPSRKLYKSSNDLFYLISGGVENWHGINQNIINQLNEQIKSDRENIFIIAKKYKTQIDIFVGSLSVFLLNKNKLIKTKKGGLQFHCIHTEDGLYLEEIPELVCNKVHTIFFPNHKRNVELYRYNASLLDIDVPTNKELTHTDIQAKLLLIGSYLNYRTYTPDVSKFSEIYQNKLGDICTEKKVPEESIPKLSLNTVKLIDVIWFDEEGYPTHAFEVEHSTDITKGLLRLYQTRKLRIKMYIISNQKNKFETEVAKSPFVNVKNDFIFKNYDELENFFESVKKFKEMKDKFKL